MAQFVAIAAGCAIVLTGCGAGQAASEYSQWGTTIAADIDNLSDTAPMSEEQRASLQDGEVTEEEVHQAFERYRSCLRDEGYELRDIAQDGPLITAGIPDGAVQSGVDAMCYAVEYGAVDVVWQAVVNADYGERAAQLGYCIDALDISVLGASGSGATVAELEVAIAEAGFSLEECPKPPAD